MPHSASPKVQKYEYGTNALEQAVAANSPTFWRVPVAFSFEGVWGHPNGRHKRRRRRPAGEWSSNTRLPLLFSNSGFSVSISPRSSLPRPLFSPRKGLLPA